MVPISIKYLIIRSLVGTVEANTFSQMQILIRLLVLFHAAPASSSVDIFNMWKESVLSNTEKSATVLCQEFTGIAQDNDVMTFADAIRRLKDVTVELAPLDDKCKNIVSIFLVRFGKSGLFPEKFQKGIPAQSVLAAALDPLFTDFDSTERISDIWSSPDDPLDVSDQELSSIQTLMGLYVEDLWYKSTGIDPLRDDEDLYKPIKAETEFNAIRAALVLFSAFGNSAPREHLYWGINGMNFLSDVNDLLPIDQKALILFRDYKERIQAFLGRFKPDANSFKLMFEEFRIFRKSRTAEVSDGIPWIDAFFGFYMDPSQCASPNISGLVQRKAESVAQLGCHLNSSEGFKEARVGVFDDVLVGVDESRKTDEQYMATIIGNMRVRDRLEFFNRSHFLVNPQLGLNDVISHLLVFAPEDRALYEKFKDMGFSLSAVCDDLLVRSLSLLSSVEGREDILNNRPLLLPALIGSPQVQSELVVHWLKMDLKFAKNLVQIRSENVPYETVYEVILTRPVGQDPVNVIKNYIERPMRELDARNAAIVEYLDTLSLEDRLRLGDITYKAVLEDPTETLRDIVVLGEPNFDNLHRYFFKLSGTMADLLKAVQEKLFSSEQLECLQTAGEQDCNVTEIVQMHPIAGVYLAESDGLDQAKIVAAFNGRMNEKTLAAFKGASSKRSSNKEIFLFAVVSAMYLYPNTEKLSGVPIMSLLHIKHMIEYMISLGDGEYTAFASDVKPTMRSTAEALMERGVSNLHLLSVYEAALEGTTLQFELNVLVREILMKISLWVSCLAALDPGTDPNCKAVRASQKTPVQLAALLKSYGRDHAKFVLQLAEIQPLEDIHLLVLMRALIDREAYDSQRLSEVLADVADPSTHQFMVAAGFLVGSARVMFFDKHPQSLRRKRRLSGWPTYSRSAIRHML